MDDEKFSFGSNQGSFNATYIGRIKQSTRMVTLSDLPTIVWVGVTRAPCRKMFFCKMSKLKLQKWMTSVSIAFCSFTDEASEERTFFSVRLKNCLLI